MKGLNLLYKMHNYVEKHIFSWPTKKVQICCIITWKSRFSDDVPKMFKFVALLGGKAGFSWHTKNSYIWCIYTWKSRFFYDATENNMYIWCIITFRSRFSHDATKTLIFDAVLSGKAGFLMTRQKRCKRIALLRDKAGFSGRTKTLIFDTWKSRFSHDTNENKGYIWCIITFRSRFSHDAPKSLLVNALLRGKAGFLMTRQKGANLLHYY